MTKLIDIDGSHGEGGGQILRTSLALSLITGQPFRLRNIRAGRARPGLQAQHLMCVQAAAEIGKAKLRGASLHSSDLTFEPGPVKSGEFHFKIGTAGATSLVLHTVYLPLALSGGESRITIEGGTHVKAAPCFHFLATTWAGYMKALGLNVELHLDRVGFYPRGGGRIRTRIGPTAQVRLFHGLTSQAVDNAIIDCGVAGLPNHVADRLTQTATERLQQLGLEVQSRRETWHGGPGCMLGVELPTTPAPTFLFSLGEKGKPAEAVAHEAVAQVEAFLRCNPPGVDEHSADQLLLPLALADDPSQFRVAAISSHLRTNAAVIERFLERRISWAGAEGEAGVVTIEKRE
jgi:RNA 3'-terminal phosphate cyclase (ATP)